MRTTKVTELQHIRDIFQDFSCG